SQYVQLWAFPSAKQKTPTFMSSYHWRHGHFRLRVHLRWTERQLKRLYTTNSTKKSLPNGWRVTMPMLWSQQMEQCLSDIRFVSTTFCPKTHKLIDSFRRTLPA